MHKTLKILLMASGIFVFALSSCNFPSKAAQVEETAAAIIASQTPTPLFLPTPTTQSFANIQQNATATDAFIFDPSLTLTPHPSPTPTNPAGVTIRVEDTKEGDYFTIHRPSDNLEYKMGPIAKGVYLIAPNGDFWVYCTLGGTVYAAKIGDDRFNLLGSVKDFMAIRKNVLPNFHISLYYNNYLYKVTIRESSYNQTRVFKLSSRIAH